MPRFEEKVLVSAREAITAKVMIIEVDEATKTMFERDREVSLLNRWLYPLMLVALWAIFFGFDLLGEFAEECQLIHHGECADERGMITALFPAMIVFIAMFPAISAATSRKAMRKRILTGLGWDGTSEYRLEAKEEEGEG